MKARVVALSRTLGAGGEQIGLRVAEELGYRYVDSDIIKLAADQAGIDVKQMSDVEARRGFLERVLERLAQGGAAMGAMGGAETPMMLENPTQELQQLIVDVIHQIASDGSAVIVAHAASMALGPRLDVLRVLVTAPEEVRQARVAEADGLGEREARRRVEESDSARAQYFQRFYRIDRELPVHYDLVVNSDQLAPEEIVGCVVTLAAGHEPVEA